MNNSSGIFTSVLSLIMNTVLIMVLAWVVMGMVTLIMAGMGHAAFFHDLLHDAMASMTDYVHHFPSRLSWAQQVIQSFIPNRTSALNVNNEVDTLFSTLPASVESQLPFINTLWQLVLLTTTFLIFKTLLLVALLPLLLILIILAISDGIVARSLRRYHGARESALIYHQSKRLAGLAYYGGVLVFLIAPLAVSPLFIFIPTALLTSLCVWVTVRQFKKYA